MRSPILQLILALALLQAGLLPVRSVEQISATLTLTNTPLTNWTLGFYGTDTRTWSSNASSTAVLVSSNVPVSTTNLYAHLVAYPPAGALGLYYTASNVLRFDAIAGSNLVLAVGGTWASITYVTQTVYTARPVLVPASAVTNLVARTNLWSGVAEGLQYASNQIAAASPAVAGLITKTNGYGTGTRLLSPSLTNAYNYGAAFVSLGSGTDSLQMGADAVASGEAASAYGNDAEASGINSTAIGFLSEASGASSTALGVAATASGYVATAIGSQARADETNCIALGAQAWAAYVNSIAIGNGVESTRTNEIRIGGGQDVVIGGLLSVVGTLSNNAIRISGGALTNVLLASSSAVVTNLTAHAAQLTNVIVHAATAVVTNLTAHAAQLTNANIHAANLNATNATIYSGYSTNVRHANSFATNLIVAGGANSFSAGAALSFVPAYLTTLANGNNVGVPLGSNVLVVATGANTADATLCGLVGAAGSGGASGQWVRFLNVTGTNVIFTQNTVDGTAANRILTPTGADHTVSNGCWVDLIYGAGTNYWRVVKPSY